MRGNFLKRLEVVEHKVNIGSEIPAHERVIAIPYPADGDEEGFEQLKAERFRSLEEKYGPVSGEMLVVKIKKFYREQEPIPPPTI